MSELNPTQVTDCSSPSLPDEIQHGVFVLRRFEWTDGMQAHTVPGHVHARFMASSKHLDALARPIQGDHSDGQFLARLVGRRRSLAYRHAIGYLTYAFWRQSRVPEVRSETGSTPQSADSRRAD